MSFKLISATEARSGSTILIDNVACVVKSNDISKSGKHGHAKCRVEAVGIIDDKKRVLAVTGADRFEVPIILKNKAQVLNLIENGASIMNLESYETLEVKIIEELKGQIKENDNVEYWDVDGIKIIKRKIWNE